MAFLFRGLGFFAPAAMFGPYFLVYVALSFQPDIDAGNWLEYMAWGAVFSIVFTYLVGKWLNKNGVEHSLFGIRFEHWGIMEGTIGAIVVLGMVIEKIGALFPAGSWLSQNVFLVYLFALIAVPIWLYRFVKKYKSIDLANYEASL